MGFVMKRAAVKLFSFILGEGEREIKITSPFLILNKA